MDQFHIGYSGQLRQPQGLENAARGKHLLVIVPIIFVRQYYYSITHVCLLEVLNMNINYFVNMET